VIGVLFLVACGAKEGFMLEVQGHRGARAARPENTLAAFEYAIEAGVDTLELDVNVTKDDRVVVVHDQKINVELCLGPNDEKLTSSPSIRALTFQELRAFDCGSTRHPRFPKQVLVPKARIPALEEVFELVKTSKHAGAKKVKLNIETKSVPGLPDLSPSPHRFARLVVDLIRKSGLEDRVILQSFDHRTLAEAKKLAPRLTLSVLSNDVHPDYVAMAASVGAAIVSPNKDWITKADVERLHAAKIRVIPWTANTPAEWRALIEMGVDGIITDDPAALLAYVR
jgi:glycerophosphoryl diester phosphodiesterase